MLCKSIDWFLYDANFGVQWVNRITTHMQRTLITRKNWVNHIKVLEYLQKNENFKNDFFTWSEFCYWTKVKAKHVFLTKIMLLNEMQAFFVSLWFFAVTFFKSNSITFRFSLSLS